MMTVVVVVAKVNGMMRVITTQVPSVGAAVRLTAEYLQGECQIDGTTVQPLAIGTYRQGATRVYTVNVERSTKFNEMMRLTAEAAINAWY